MAQRLANGGGDVPASGVGIVVVSHSRALARAAIALASEMLHGRPVRFAVAAGLDDTTFGTDAVRIKEAIEQVDGPAGVVVLMDLGSAVLSAELALDLLDDQAVRSRVVLSPAPVVEGLVVAAVAAAGGASRDEVAAEARGAILGKAAHLASSDAGTVPGSGDAAASDVVGEFVVTNRHGLHARPAARLVSELRGLDAAVTLQNTTSGAGPVPGTSLSRVATLAALEGHTIQINASGPQAHEAVEHVLALARRRFDEMPDTGSPPPRSPARSSDSNTTLRPVPDQGAFAASPGVAIGPVRQLNHGLDLLALTAPDDDPGGVPDAEWRRIIEAVAQVRREVERLRVVTARDVGPNEATIFDAHLALLGDTDLLANVKQRIASGAGALRAWALCVTEVERQWADLPDQYLRARAADVRAVGEQVVRALTGSAATAMTGRGILVTGDLTPADAAELDRDLVAGIVLAAGSPVSHAAILARSRGIPAVVGAGPGVLGWAEGVTVVIDGGTGEVVVDPSAPDLAAFRERADGQARREAQHLASAGQPASTRDGIRIEVAANLGSAADARVAVAAGADGAGLVRTEFMFLGRDRAPAVAEQEMEYQALATVLNGRRMTLRTLDVGGDKPLPYLPIPEEQNPFLGIRGIRISLRRTDLLVDQLRAMCAVGRRAPVDVMFPMVTSVGELIDARRLLLQAAGPDGLPHDLRVGIMVETPAAALKIETFLPYLDFVSIGTNDLTQYALAAERGNPAVADLSDALDPAVLQLVRHVCRACDGRVPVSVCGEIASDEAAIPLLLGLGISELSVAPYVVPSVKSFVRELDIDACKALADKAMAMRDAAEVRNLINGGADR